MGKRKSEEAASPNDHPGFVDNDDELLDGFNLPPGMRLRKDGLVETHDGRLKNADQFKTA